jgi:hypothetical protein
MKEWIIADLNINVDAVLRGQGADPDIIRIRSPRLINIADEALAESIDLLEPEVLVREQLNVVRSKLLQFFGSKLGEDVVPGDMSILPFCVVSDNGGLHINHSPKKSFREVLAPL